MNAAADPGRTAATVAPEDIRRFLALLARPGDVFELRAVSKRRKIAHAGYFDDMDALSRAAADRSRRGADDGIYVTLNPVHDGLLSRYPANQVHEAVLGTSSDSNVLVRRRLLLDFDPVRPSNISSTDEEHNAAIALALSVAADLASSGWPEPLVGDSGNGGHLLYAIELPCDDDGLVKRVLLRAAQRYSSAVCKIDTEMFNPSRISKIYGTLARKGTNDPRRPHRISRIVSAPTELVIVTREQLEAFAPSTERGTSTDRRSGGRTNHSEPQWNAERAASFFPDAIEGPWDGCDGARRKWILPECPWDPNHRRTAFIGEFHSGAWTARCLNAACSWTSDDLRDRLDPGWRERRNANGANGHRTTNREPWSRAAYEADDDRAYWNGPPPGGIPHDDHANGAPGSSFHDSVNNATDKGKPADPWQAALAKARVDVDRALGDHRSTDRRRLFAPLADLFTREYPQTQWKVGRLITRGGIGIVGALPKDGKKTWIACEIALSVATGSKVFGEFLAERGTVAQFCAEDLDVQLRNRYRALAAGRGIDPTTIANLYVCPRGQFVDVLKNEDLAWIIASCRAIGRVDLVILDPLRDIHSGEENESDSMRDVMRRLRLITELLGCTLLVTHHVPKTTQDNAKRAAGENLRGSGAIRGSLDAGIYVTPRGGDGVANFELNVISEVKGARGAGCFKLELAIEDDAQDEAVRAEFTVRRTAAPDAPPEPVAVQDPRAKERQDHEDRMFEFIRQLAMGGTYLTRTQLRGHKARPIPHGKVIPTCDRLVEFRRIRIDLEGIVRLPDGHQTVMGGAGIGADGSLWGAE